SALIVIFALAFLSTLESCTTRNNSTATTIKSENFSLLSKGGWVMSSATKDFGAPEGELDMFFFMDESEKNDVLYFYPNSKTVRSSKVFKSGRIDIKDVMQGNWSLAEDDSKLIIQSGENVTELIIETLNDSELVISVIEFDETLDKKVKSTFGYKS
ncbi:MAG: lipocalin family protein, partial [Salibacteraceae bacterium]